MPLSVSLSQHSWLPRRPSVPSTSSPSNPAPVVGRSGLKGKDRSHDTADATPLEFGYNYGHNIDNVASKSSESSTSSAPYDPSSHSAPLHSHFQPCSGSLASRHRSSLLSAASDVFGLRKKFGSMSRKKPNFSSLSHACDIVPEFIEINAHNNTTVTSTVGGTTAHKDYEYEERERLRDAAAQSIGLDPELLHDSFKSESRLSLDSPGTPLQSDPIPPFPTTLGILRPSTELSATLPKFTPPSSLLVYALSKQWKSRTIVLTSHSASQKIHVHLFKSSSKDEKEIERLEVTEDSVIFVAEEEVGGRGSVIKFAGKDVSQKRTGETGEDSMRTMWFLQITDPAESQRWISVIKNAVLTQRAVRAGLDIRTETDGGNEPKGDIDVMLSMHLQGLISPQPIKPSPAMLPLLPVRTSPSPSPSLRSLRINIPSSPSPTTMKGMFSGRPRSPSVEGSLTPIHPSGQSEDSFSAVGTNLLTMIRSKSSADFGSSQSHPLPLPSPHVPSPAPSLRLLNSPVVIAGSDLKISKERDIPESSTAVEETISSTTPSSNTPPTPSFSAQGPLALSLQPPPRKSKHAVAPIPVAHLHEQRGMYKQAGGNRSVAGNFGIQSRSSGDDTPRDDISLASPTSSHFSGGISGSLSSNPGFDALSSSQIRASEQEDESDGLPSTMGNGITSSSLSEVGHVPSDKLSYGTGITKRWSRQGGRLPKQLAPPSGPPPSIPLSSEENQRSSAESNIYVPANYVADHSPSGSSFASQSRARISVSSSSPTFWKRASGCSTYSISSTSTDSRDRTPFGSDSLPSLGSVVGKGATGRPMSLLISGSSISGHVKTTKRRSMPPPRPAPNFAPPPAPTIEESTSGPAPLTVHAPAPIKSLRTSVAQRALWLSVASPKPPPSSSLPPRPDEAEPAPRHRRTSSADTLDLHPAPAPPSRPVSTLSADVTSIHPTSPSARSLSIRQRLRILSTSPVQPPSLHSIQMSTLDLSDENDDDLPTPSVHAPQPFALGEHITGTQDDPSFLQLSTPITPTVPKPPPRSPFRPSLTTSGLATPPLEPDLDFVSLSPPPPRRGSKPNVVTATRSEKPEAIGSGPAQREESKPSARGSVVSLGFVTAS